MTVIAVTSQNRREITEHAGQCRNFLLFEAQGTQVGEPRLVELPLGASLHDTPHDRPHALDGVDVLISASMGDGLRRKLMQRGINPTVTSERDPSLAVRRYLLGDLPDLGDAHLAEAAPAPADTQAQAHAGCGHCCCGHSA